MRHSIWLRRAPAVPVAPALTVHSQAPTVPEAASSAPTWLIAFIRHVGCPFAEHSIKELRGWAQAHPETPVYVVSHGDAAITQDWLDIIGGLGGLRFIHDPDRHLYGQWGLGDSPFWHFGGPRSLMGVMRLWFKGIRNRMATGTRWQRAGVFLVREGRVVWCHVPRSAQEFELPP